MTFAVAAATVAAAAVTAGAAAGGSPGAAAAASRAAAAGTTSSVGDYSAFDPTMAPGLTAGHANAAPVHPSATRSPAHIQVAVSAATRQPHSAHQAAGRRLAVQHPAARSSPAHHTGQARRAAKPAKPKPAKVARAAQRQPYRIYDSVTPSSIPARQAAAVYATGSYYASPTQTRGLGHVLWIDTTGRDYAASVLDVEPGDATPAQAANWVAHRLQANPHAVARIYTMISQWQAARSAIAGLPSWMQSHVRWWIADPTGTPHIVPGADATQWYWGSNYDITAARPGF